jgi:hypothetical protein
LAAPLGLLAAIGAIIRPQGPILTTYTNPILLEFLAGVLLAAASPRLMRSEASGEQFSFSWVWLGSFRSF